MSFASLFVCMAVLTVVWPCIFMTSVFALARKLPKVPACMPRK